MFCSCIVFMSSLGCQFVFSWVLLCLLKVIILNSISVNSQILFSLESILEKYRLFGGIMFLWFFMCVCDAFELMSTNLRDQSHLPVFQTDSLKKYFHLKVAVRAVAGWGVPSLISNLPHHRTSMQLAAKFSDGKDYSALLCTRMQ